MMFVIGFACGLLVAVMCLAIAALNLKPETPMRKESATKELIRQRLYAGGFREGQS